MEGNLRFKIDWANLIVGSKFTVFALFYFVFAGNFPRTSPWGAYIWRGDLTEGVSRYRFGGLIFGQAYFRNFTVSEILTFRLWKLSQKDLGVRVIFFFSSRFLHIAVVQGDQPLTEFFIQKMKSRGVDIYNKLRQVQIHLCISPPICT